MNSISNVFYTHLNAESQGIAIDWRKVAATMSDMLQQAEKEQAPETDEGGTNP